LVGEVTALSMGDAGLGSTSDKVVERGMVLVGPSGGKDRMGIGEWGRRRSVGWRGKEDARKV
jgi:hypothetical protein